MISPSSLKRKRYLASEWLRMCDGKNERLAFDHAAAFEWWTLEFSYGYEWSARLAESAEYGERAIGLEPVAMVPRWRK